MFLFYLLVCSELLIWPGCWCEHVVSCLLGLLSPATTTPESRCEWPESLPFQSLSLSQNSNMPNWIAPFISSGTKPDHYCSSHHCCYSNMKAVLDLHFVLSMTLLLSVQIYFRFCTPHIQNIYNFPLYLFSWFQAHSDNHHNTVYMPFEYSFISFIINVGNSTPLFYSIINT